MQSFKIFRNVLFHGHFVEEEPAGVACAVVPMGALLGGVDGYADVAGGRRFVECFFDADEFHFRMAVFGEIVARQCRPVDAVVADGIGDGFGLEDPGAELLKEIGVDAVDLGGLAEVDGEVDVGAFPADPRIFICGAAEEAVGERGSAEAVVRRGERFGEGDGGAGGEVVLVARQLALAVEPAVF